MQHPAHTFGRSKYIVCWWLCNGISRIMQKNGTDIAMWCNRWVFFLNNLILWSVIDEISKEKFDHYTLILDIYWPNSKVYKFHLLDIKSTNTILRKPQLNNENHRCRKYIHDINRSRSNCIRSIIGQSFFL